MHTVLVGKPDGKNVQGGRDVDGNIKLDLREVGCDSGDWIALAEDRDQWRAYIRTVMNLRVMGGSPGDVSEEPVT